MSHVWFQKETPTNCSINGKPAEWDQYYACSECSVIKVIRKSGRIDYISKDALKLFNGEPACLKIIASLHPTQIEEK